MAKQKSVLQFRGKLGQIVGMKNGFGGSEAFARSYVADPKNPQTAGQTAQRVRLLPAVNFRRQLQSVISRAWEGTKYGGASTRKFMKYALKEPLANIPQVMKDESLAIPGKYLVSRGSLASITTEFSGNNLVFGLACGDFGAPNEANKWTLGYLTRQLIDLNGGVVADGDQLTVICCYSNDATNAELTNVLYAVSSIVLNLNSEADVREIDAGFKAIDEGLAYTKNKRLLGGCIVLSREGTSHLRNTTRFEVNESDTQLKEFFSESLKTSVKRSYTKSATTSVNWPYEESEIEDDVIDDTPFLVSVVSNNGTLGTVTGGGTFNRGDIVTCQATALEGAFFSDWRINNETISEEATLQYEATGPVTIVAFFESDDRP